MPSLIMKSFIPVYLFTKFYVIFHIAVKGGLYFRFLRPYPEVELAKNDSLELKLANRRSEFQSTHQESTLLLCSVFCCFRV